MSWHQQDPSQLTGIDEKVEIMNALRKLIDNYYRKLAKVLKFFKKIVTSLGDPKVVVLMSYLLHFSLSDSII